MADILQYQVEPLLNINWLSFWGRAWEALKEATRCQALVIVYRGHCVLQAGLAAESEEYAAVFVDCSKFIKGSLCRDVWASGKRNLLLAILATRKLYLK